ncbi:MAG: hypothetical protein ACKOWG_06355, partial [Planctomycetia bacterium]
LQGQGHDLVAEVLRFLREFTRCFSRCHRSRSLSVEKSLLEKSVWKKALRKLTVDSRQWSGVMWMP